MSLDLIYTIIIDFFDNNLSSEDLNRIEIYDIFYTYFQIIYFISNVVEKELYNTFGVNEIDPDNTGSIFDEYDKENGYEDDVLEKDHPTAMLEVLNGLIRYSIKNLNNSLNETLNMDIFNLLDYMKFEFENREEVEEDYT